jgi:hypothetical protein
MKFKNWLTENTANDVKSGMDALSGGLKHGMEEKNLEYAKRIVAGEDPNVVMQGIKINGIMWQRVMQKVAELKGQQQQQNNQFSIAGLEQKLGFKPGTFDIRPSKDGQHIFVRNRATGKYKAVGHNPQEIEQAAKELYFHEDI